MEISIPNDTSLSSKRYREIIEATVTAWNSHNLEELCLHLAEDIVLYHPSLSVPIIGKANYIAYDREFLEAFPDANIEVKNIVPGDCLAAFEFIMRGTQLGYFRGRNPTGRLIEIPVVEVCAFRQERICEVRRYLDPSLYARQLGF